MNSPLAPIGLCIGTVILGLIAILSVSLSVNLHNENGGRGRGGGGRGPGHYNFGFEFVSLRFAAREAFAFRAFYGFVIRKAIFLKFPFKDIQRVFERPVFRIPNSG